MKIYKFQLDKGFMEIFYFQFQYTIKYRYITKPDILQRNRFQTNKLLYIHVVVIPNK